MDRQFKVLQLKGSEQGSTKPYVEGSSPSRISNTRLQLNWSRAFDFQSKGCGFKSRKSYQFILPQLNWTELQPSKLLVVGSNPTGSAKLSKCCYKVVQHNWSNAPSLDNTINVVMADRRYAPDCKLGQTGSTPVPYSKFNADIAQRQSKTLPMFRPWVQLPLFAPINVRVMEMVYILLLESRS